MHTKIFCSADETPSSDPEPNAKNTFIKIKLSGKKHVSVACINKSQVLFNVYRTSKIM